MANVIIVGLGRIGAGNIGLAGETPMSHVAAVLANPELSIIGLVDGDAAARAAVLENHPMIEPGVVVSELHEIPRKQPEIVSICTPPESHAGVLALALERAPRVVIVEKPLATDVAVGRAMTLQAAETGTVLRVNFNRRFDANYANWRSAALGTPRAIVVRYGKGLWNYASHVVDLLLDWYGAIENVQALGDMDRDAAFPNLSFRCRMAAGFDAVFVGISGLNYDQMEIDIFNSDDRLEIRAGGAEVRRYVREPDRYYKGYAYLEELVEQRLEKPVSGFAELYRSIGSHVFEGAPLGGCDGAEAVANMAVLDAAIRSAEGGGLPISLDDEFASADKMNS